MNKKLKVSFIVLLLMTTVACTSVSVTPGKVLPGQTVNVKASPCCGSYDLTYDGQPISSGQLVIDQNETEGYHTFVIERTTGCGIAILWCMFDDGRDSTSILVEHPH